MNCVRYLLSIKKKKLARAKPKLDFLDKVEQPTTPSPSGKRCIGVKAQKRSNPNRYRDRYRRYSL